jgi:hypothetical protein
VCVTGLDNVDGAVPDGFENFNTQLSIRTEYSNEKILIWPVVHLNYPKSKQLDPYLKLRVLLDLVN